MTQWEYRQDAVPVDRHLRVLQAAGQEGWELCGVVPTALTARVSVPGVPPTQPGLLLLFKRPVFVANGQAPVSADRQLLNGATV